ncbi:MAG: protein translocase subunit SecF, partial [Candidatus Altiarchaeales archaeon]
LGKELQSLDVIKIYLPENTSLSSDFLETLKKVTVADIKLDKERNLVTIKGIDLEEEKIKRIFEYRLGFTPRIDVNKKNFRMQTIGPSLGEKFREQGFWALIFAYILIVVVVFLIFRDFVPSIAIILAATCDAIAAFGGMSLFDIVLEPASLVSILMLIGYSVDTDILLTTRVLRGERGTINERIDNAMKTGLTMTTTTIVVMVTVIVLTNFLGVPVLSSIATVLLIGLLMDILTTWLMNAGLLKMYLEEMKGKPKSGVKK